MKPGIVPALLTGLLVLGSITALALDWNPRLVAQWPAGTNAASISVAAATVSSNYGYLAEGSDGIEVLDLSQPAHPVSLGRAPTGGRQGIAVSGTQACVMTDTSLEVFDVSDPLNPHRVGALDANAGGFDAAGPFAVAAHYFYVTGTSNLSVIDIGDPSNPHRVGGVRTGGITQGLAASNGVVCLAEDIGLEIVDVSDPANPRVLGALPITDGANQVGLLGQYACVATVDLDLVVVDITNPPPTPGGQSQPAHLAWAAGLAVWPRIGVSRRDTAVLARRPLISTCVMGGTTETRGFAGCLHVPRFPTRCPRQANHAVARGQACLSRFSHTPTG